MALGEDLGADEDVGLPGAFEPVAEAAPRARRVAVEPHDPRLGKALAQRSLDSLRPPAESLQAGVAALGAGAGYAFDEAAVVATQAALGKVHDQVGRAAPTALQPPACGAGEHGRVTAPVEENERLFAPAEAQRQRLQQRSGETVANWMQPGVDEAHGRQRGAWNRAALERYELVPAGIRPLESLERWGRRAQDHGRSGDVRPRDGELARRVPDAVALLERSVLLFVDHDHAEPGQRREYSEPGAEHDKGETAVREKPATGALDLGHRARLCDDAGPGEAAAQGGLQRGGERYLRNEHQRLLSCREDLGDEP